MAGTNIRVLIVDGDEVQREGLAEWLQCKEKIFAQKLATGEEALASIHEASGKSDLHRRELFCQMNECLNSPTK